MKKGWFHVELKGYRHSSDEDTYIFYDYDRLPLLPKLKLKGDFSWLIPAPIDSEFQPEVSDSDIQKNLNKMKSEAETKGVIIPKVFQDFICNTRLRNTVEKSSITACFFELTSGIISVPDHNGEYLIHFFSDQQGCCFWYIYFNNDMELGIVLSEFLYEGNGKELFPNQNETIDMDKFTWVSPDLESFILRLIIEDALWNKLSRDKPEFNDWEMQYLNYFREAE